MSTEGRNPIKERRTLTVLLVMSGFMLGGDGWAQQPMPGAPAMDAAEALVPDHEVRITDLSTRFVRFYDAARAENAEEARRWELWKDHYDFAALPPVPGRDSLAREMLEAACPRYPEVIDRVRRGAAALEPSPDSILRVVARHLEVDEPVSIHLLVFVGNIEAGAFFAPTEDELLVALPIEEPRERRMHGMAHEFTHAIHHRLAGLSGGWERSIARTLFSEGLANRMEQAVFPGRPESAYVEHRPGWFHEAEARRDRILLGILPHLRDSTSDQVMRFTLGSGTTGLEREGYYAGWMVVGHLLALGHTLAELARVPEREIPILVDARSRRWSIAESSAASAAVPRPAWVTGKACCGSRR